MSSSLLTTRRFAPLFWCQFFSAFNDNFLKNSLAFLILFKMAGQDSAALIQLAGAIFIFPFFILSAIGGEIADRYDKALVAQRLKLVEIAVAAIAVGGFWLHSVPLLFAALFLLGVISALFGPIKYGILPDHLAESRAAGRQRAGRGRHLHRHPERRHRGRSMRPRAAGDPASLVRPDDRRSGCCAGSPRCSSRPTGEGAPNLVIDFNIARSTVVLLRDLYAQEPRLWWGGHGGELVLGLIGAVVLNRCCRLW
jgi:acyl-[acyl-carrier-protein]-phospholipid O-acyltransferase/long-chain-fatty-acid--[acyl-carrier-protein] ligase